MEEMILFKVNNKYIAFSVSASDAHEERQKQLEFNDLDDKEKSKLIQKIVIESKNRLDLQDNLSIEDVYKIIEDIEIQYQNILIHESNYNIIEIKW